MMTDSTTPTTMVPVIDFNGFMLTSLDGWRMTFAVA